MAPLPPGFWFAVGTIIALILFLIVWWEYIAKDLFISKPMPDDPADQEDEMESIWYAHNSFGS